MLALVILGACGGSQLPEERNGAEIATDGLEQLGRGNRPCTCTFDNTRGAVWLSCLDSDLPDGIEEFQVTRFGFLSSQGQRRFSFVDWALLLSGSEGERHDNVGIALTELTPSIVDRRGGDLTTVWTTLHIHKMRVDPVDSLVDSAADAGGFLSGGRYWCEDVNSNPWDLDPSWQGRSL